MLLSRYLDYSLPYQTLFTSSTLSSYRAYLLDALAGLLLQLHLAGVFWGDCSLSNALFRRDAGALQAYLVDAETSAIHSTLSEGQRVYDLEIMEENVYGARRSGGLGRAPARLSGDGDRPRSADATRTSGRKLREKRS